MLQRSQGTGDTFLFLKCRSSDLLIGNQKSGLFCLVWIALVLFKTGFLYEVLAIPDSFFVDRLELNSQRSVCLCLTSDGLKGVSHYAQLKSGFLWVGVPPLKVWCFGQKHLLPKNNYVK